MQQSQGLTCPTEAASPATVTMVTILHSLESYAHSPRTVFRIWHLALAHNPHSCQHLLSLGTVLPPSPSRGSKPILGPSLQIRGSSFRDACSSLVRLDPWAYRGGEGVGGAEKSSEPEADKGSHSSVPEGKGINPLMETQRKQSPRKRGTETQREGDRDQGEGECEGIRNPERRGIET